MGNFKIALFLAYKSIIRGNRWALFLIILVMSLSFVNLLLTSSILSGLTVTLDNQQIENVLGNIVIDPQDNEYYLEHVSQIEREVEQLSGVVGVASHINNSAFIEYKWQEKASFSDKGKSGTWSVVGIDPAREIGVTAIHSHIISGSYLEENDRDKILLGIEIAGGEGAQITANRNLGGARAGEKVRLTYPNGIQREYTIKGVFHSREMTRADHTAFVTRQEMLSVMGREAFADRASQVLVKIEKSNEENSLIAEIKTLGIDGQVRSWKDYRNIGSIVSSFDIIASLINGIGLIVAAIVMFIVIYINVLNKRRQIGILRAIGIKREIVIISYLTQALFFAVCGVIFGGLLFGYVLMPYFDIHPLDLPLGLLKLVVVRATVEKAVWGLILAGVCAGIIPVISIIRQSIIKSIWGN